MSTGARKPVARRGSANKRIGGQGETRKKRLSREQRAPEARAEILAAAVSVVGDVGYANATIDKIVSAAGMAQGTFYLYFRSRQDLFDQLLPYAGMEMFGFIGERVEGSRTIYELEARGMEAFFEYMRLNPGFSRIINEAEAAAPKAYTAHLNLLKDRYLKSLKKSVERGEIRTFAEEELEAVAYMLMSCRHYLHMRYMKMGPNDLPLGKVVQIYSRFVRAGLK